LYMFECGGPVAMVNRLVEDAKVNSHEWIAMSVPALLYTVQNNCLYIGFLHLEAAVGQVTYQSKIFFTAVCSVWMLGKKLTPAQWFSLLLLAVGVVCVQGADWFAPVEHLDRNSTLLPRRKRKLQKDIGGAAGIRKVASFGFAAFLLAALCTSFASVYFERMLKGSNKPSLWLRNIQLAAYSSVIAAAALQFSNDPKVASEGWFHGFSYLTWVSITWQAGGGILVAVTIKYADNILRGFAQALAIIVASFGSSFTGNWSASTPFVAGVILVISAVFLYGDACCFSTENCCASQQEMKVKSAQATEDQSCERLIRAAEEHAESEDDVQRVRS